MHELGVPVMLATQPPLHRKEQSSQGSRGLSQAGLQVCKETLTHGNASAPTQPESPRESSQSFLPASAVSWEEGCPTDVLGYHFSGALCSTEQVFLLMGDPVWNGHQGVEEGASMW